MKKKSTRGPFNSLKTSLSKSTLPIIQKALSQWDSTKKKWSFPKKKSNCVSWNLIKSISLSLLTSFSKDYYNSLQLLLSFLFLILQRKSHVYWMKNVVFFLRNLKFAKLLPTGPSSLFTKQSDMPSACCRKCWLTKEFRFTTSTFEADLILVPAEKLQDAYEILQKRIATFWFFLCCFQI